MGTQSCAFGGAVSSILPASATQVTSVTSLVRRILAYHISYQKIRDLIHTPNQIFTSNNSHLTGARIRSRNTLTILSQSMVLSVHVEFLRTKISTNSSPL